MMWWEHGSGSVGWPGMSLTMLVFWGAAIWFIIWLAGTWSKVDAPPPSRRADDVHAVRFARGDIDDTQYQARLRVLQGKLGGQPPQLDKSGAPR
jgi:putative membrane protein